MNTLIFCLAVCDWPQCKSTTDLLTLNLTGGMADLPSDIKATWPAA
jgi:hypothetical protein